MIKLLLLLDFEGGIILIFSIFPSISINIISKFLHGLISTAVQDDRVATCFIHLDDRMASRNVKDFNITDIHVQCMQIVLQEDTVRADGSGEENGKAGLCQRCSLIETFAAFVLCVQELSNIASYNAFAFESDGISVSE